MMYGVVDEGEYQKEEVINTDLKTIKIKIKGAMLLISTYLLRHL